MIWSHSSHFQANRFLSGVFLEHGLLKVVTLGDRVVNFFVLYFFKFKLARICFSRHSREKKIGRLFFCGTNPGVKHLRNKKKIFTQGKNIQGWNPSKAILASLFERWHITMGNPKWFPGSASPPVYFFSIEDFFFQLRNFFQLKIFFFKSKSLFLKKKSLDFFPWTFVHWTFFSKKYILGFFSPWIFVDICYYFGVFLIFLGEVDIGKITFSAAEGGRFFFTPFWNKKNFA